MNTYITRESNNIESDFIIDKIVEYNLSIIPSKQETDFLCINRVIEDETGKIIAGILRIVYI